MQMLSFPQSSSLVARLFGFVLTIGLLVPLPEGHAQVRINEVDYEDNWVELYNAGTSTIDVSDYELCTFPNYAPISSLTILSGNTSMNAGEFLVVEWTHLSTSDGEVGLYFNDDNFGDAGNMADYMEYGSAGHTRESVAVDAGEWESGEYVPLASSGKTLSFFDTAGEIGEEDWGESNETQGMANDPIPVELTAFDATAEGTTAHLAWHTASETNNAGFEVHHQSPRASSFETVAFVKGQGTTSEPHAYQQTINALASGTHVFRLKQLDVDGTYDFSRPVTVHVHLNSLYQMSSLHPTPTAQSARFTITVKETQHVTIEVYDMLGRTVKQLYEDRLRKETHRRFTVNTEALPPGQYYVRAASDHFTATKELVVVK